MKIRSKEILFKTIFTSICLFVAFSSLFGAFGLIVYAVTSLPEVVLSLFIKILFGVSLAFLIWKGIIGPYIDKRRWRRQRKMDILIMMGLRETHLFVNRGDYWRGIEW